MRAKRRMTAAEFEAVRPFLNISEDRKTAAYTALVEGKTLKEIGDGFGWSRQAVGDAVGIVWNSFQNYLESQRITANAGTLLPPGWEQVTLIAPSSLITKFRNEIAAAANQEAPSNRKVKARK